MLYLKMKKTKFFLFSFVFIGLLFRVYLLTTLPLWHDEAYSIWASKSLLSRIISGSTDYVHPPGYYFLLHLWGKVFDHLFWFRFLTIICFIFNILLLYKLGKHIKDSLYSLILVFLYCFSGYFVVFDWQVRMYSLIVSFILLSLFIFDKGIKNKYYQKISFWILFTAVNLIGLYIDYSYFWYYIPLTLFSFIFSLTKNKNRKYLLITLSLVLSGVLFIIIHPSFLFTYKQGIGGITWAKTYILPNFFIPYLLGTHKNVFLTFIFTALFLFGIKISFNTKPPSTTILVLMFSSLFSLLFSLIYSIFFSPLLHVRSLQVVAITAIVIIGLSIYHLCRNIGKYLYFLFYVVIFINFILAVQTIIASPGKVLVSFFPWKNTINKLDVKNTKVVQYQENQKLPTPLLLWGLEYTLKGKESLPVKKFELEKKNSSKKDENCTLFYDGLLELYNCN